MFNKIGFFIGLVIFLTLATPLVAQGPADLEQNGDPNRQANDSPGGSSTPPPLTSPMEYAMVYKLDVRSGHGLDYGIKGWLYRGQPVVMLGRNSTTTWLKVEAMSGFERWVFANYVRSNVPITSLPVIQ